MQRVFEIYIKTTPERLWEAITNPDLRAKYSFDVAVYSDWTVGSAVRAAPKQGPDFTIFEGEVLECDPPRRLVHTSNARWSDEVKAEGTSRVTWEIEPIADSCKLTVTHSDLRENANPQLYGGWMMVLSGLKTLLETGELLTTPASLQFARHLHEA